MKAVKLLINIYIMSICFLSFAWYIVYINAVFSIIGIILFVYLRRTRQLAITGVIFLLIPHAILFAIAAGKRTWSSFDAYEIAYKVVQFGLPFLLYCFLQVTGRAYVIIARILCFVLPILTIFVYILTLVHFGI